MPRMSCLAIVPLLIVAGSASAQQKAEKAAKEKAEKKENPIVEVQTNYGTFYLEVFLKETPIHAENFLSIVKAGKYDSLTFHRIVPGFVIQGGDPTGTGAGSMTNKPLPDEKSPYPEVRGTVAMARSPAGASDCQFYINLKDNTFLDKQKFSAFARVVQGMDVVDRIAKVKTGPNDRPVEPVIMLKVRRVEELPKETKG